MLDLDRMRNRSQGIIEYSLGLARALIRCARDDETIVVLTSRSVAREIEDDVRGRHVLIVDDREVDSWYRLWLDFIGYRWPSGPESFDAVIFPKGMIPLVRPRVRTCAAVLQDDIPIRYFLGEFGSRRPLLKNAYVSARLLFTLARSDLVFASSQVTCERLMRYTRRRSVVAIGAGLNVERDVDGERSPSGTAPDRHVLLFASQLPHKRTSQVVDWMLRMKEDLAGHDVEVIGSLPGDCSVPRDWIRHQRPLSRSDLLERMSSALVVVYHTSYEGFGLPPLEAVALGVPVVYPSIRPLIDHLQDVPGAYEAAEFESFRRAFQNALKDGVVGREVQRSVLDAVSWELTARRVLEAIAVSSGTT